MSSILKNKVFKYGELVFLGILVLFVCANIYNYYKIPKIERVLKSSSYSYLPYEAKNYIKEYYLETGQILLTEENKKESEPYLNPKYVEYLTLSDEEKLEYGVIPESIIIDFQYGVTLSNEVFPEFYSLENVDGKKFLTPNQDQYGGLCWAYSSTSQVESKLLINEDVSYYNDFKLFSERQLDYATSKNGIVDDFSLYPYRSLLDEGGAYSWMWSVGVDGLTFADISWEKDILGSVNKLEPNKVYSFKNSLYEVLETVVMPNLNLGELDLTKAEDVAKRNDYLNSIKSLVKYHGGAVAGTFSPEGGCSIAVEDGKTLIYDTSTCVSGGGHAMHVVGWDDNYEYSFCEINKELTSDTSKCNEEDIVSGKGAWILKNSWGDYLPFLYLAYDGYGTTYSAVTDLSERSWDNYYYGDMISNYIVEFKKSNDYDEMIDKLKINVSTGGIGDEPLDIYMSVDDSNYEKIGTVDNKMQGFRTIDLSDKNLEFSGQSYKFKLQKGNSSIYISDSNYIRLYTDNVSGSLIETEDYVYSPKYTSEDVYLIRLNQITRNIEDGSLVSYKIVDLDGNEIDDNYTVSENVVFANRIYPKIMIDKSIDLGKYKVITSYNGVEMSEASLEINNLPVPINGSGTEDDPYIITNARQLNLIRTVSSSYFELANDIDLSFETKDKDGEFYNNGLGWEPISFESVSTIIINGNGHKIKGLYINRPDEDYVGLFRKLQSRGSDSGLEIIIKDLYFEDSDITGNNFVGIVAGEIDSASNIYVARINNLFSLGGSVTGNNYVGGLFGKLRLGNVAAVYDRVNSLFNSATVTANNYAGGIIGTIENTHVSSSHNVYIGNLMNIGSVISNGKAGGLIGNVFVRNSNSINIKNAISIGNVNGSVCSKGITCEVTEGSVGKFNLNDIYYTADSGFDATDVNTVALNVKKYNLSELLEINIYNDWDEFSNYWKQDSYNDIKRLPYLKNMNIDYIVSKDSSIQIDVDEMVNIDSFLDNYSSYEISSLDSNIVLYNSGIITGKNYGKTFISVTGKNEILLIPVYIVDDSVYEISFDSNGGSGTMETLNTSLNSSNLPKNIFTKEGYIFTGWNTEADGSGSYFDDEHDLLDFLEFDTKITLYAQWSPIKFNIIYHSNDGTKRTEKVNNIEYDSDVLAMEYDFSNPYQYTFIYWNTKEDGSGTTYNVGDKISKACSEDGATIDIYAIYKSYRVSFDGNGAEGTMDDVVFYEGDTASVPKNEFVKEGYKFKYFSTNPDGTGTQYRPGGIFNKLTGDLKLYAHFEVLSYPIDYYRYIDGVLKRIDTVYYNYDEGGVILEAQPDIDGYIFDSWNTKKDGTGETYLPGAKVEKLLNSLSLYVIYKPINYKVRFNSNDGNGNTVEQDFIYDTEQALKFNEFEREGYKFVGWNTKEDGSGTAYTDGQLVSNLSTVDGVIVDLYAVYSPINYKVRFNSNNGSDNTIEQEFVYGVEQALKLNEFERDGYKFIGWNTKEDGSGTAYTNGESVLNLTMKDSTIIDLYAVWVSSFTYQINNYTVDEDNLYIDNVSVNTTLDDFVKNIELGETYKVEVDLNDKTYISTGSVTKIYNGDKIVIEYVNIVRGEVTGDGVLNYLDYVNLYNHIQKVKNPDSDKKLLSGVYLVAGDMSCDDKIDYLDYVRIYNKIKELKGGN